MATPKSEKPINDKPLKMPDIQLSKRGDRDLLVVIDKLVAINLIAAKASVRTARAVETLTRQTHTSNTISKNGGIGPEKMVLSFIAGQGTKFLERRISGTLDNLFAKTPWGKKVAESKAKEKAETTADTFARKQSYKDAANSANNTYQIWKLLQRKFGDADSSGTPYKAPESPNGSGGETFGPLGPAGPKNPLGGGYTKKWPPPNGDGCCCCKGSSEKVERRETNGLLNKIITATEVLGTIAATIGAGKLATKALGGFVPKVLSTGVETVGGEVLAKGATKALTTGSNVLGKVLSTGVETVGGEVLAKGATKALTTGSNVLGKVFPSTSVAEVVTEKVAEKAIPNIGTKLLTKAGEEVVPELGTKIAVKGAGKLGFKTLGKSIPLLGAGLGAYYAYQKAKEGDYTGAALEASSGLAGAVGLSPLSWGLSGISATRDLAGAGVFGKENSGIGSWWGKPREPKVGTSVKANWWDDLTKEPQEPGSKKSFLKSAKGVYDSVHKHPVAVETAFGIGNATSNIAAGEKVKEAISSEIGSVGGGIVGGIGGERLLGATAIGPLKKYSTLFKILGSMGGTLLGNKLARPIGKSIVSDPIGSIMNSIFGNEALASEKTSPKKTKSETISKKINISEILQKNISSLVEGIFSVPKNMAVGIVSIAKIGDKIIRWVMKRLNPFNFDKDNAQLWREADYEGQTDVIATTGNKITGGVGEFFGNIMKKMGLTPSQSMSKAGGTSVGMGGGSAEKGLGESGSSKEGMSFLQSKGWTKEQAAGIIGNLQSESGKDMKTNSVGDDGQAYGIAQWHPDRQKMFAKVMGKDIKQSSFKEQLAFVDWELNNTEKKAGDQIKEAKTADGAAAAVDIYYERSSGKVRGQRQSNALALLNTNEGSTALSKPKSTLQNSVELNPSVKPLVAVPKPVKQGAFISAETKSLEFARKATVPVSTDDVAGNVVINAPSNTNVHEKQSGNIGAVNNNNDMYRIIALSGGLGDFLPTVIQH